MDPSNCWYPAVLGKLTSLVHLALTDTLYNRNSMNMKWLVVAVVSLVGVIVFSAPAYSIASNERGLTATPLRSEAAVVAGQSTSGSFLVSNFTTNPMTVNISIERFAVKDGTYEYEFDSPKNEWVQFASDKKIVLQPREERKVPYTITVPGNAPSGGYYYALLAGMEVPGSGVSSELRVASLLYLAVDGGALSRSSELVGVAVPLFVMEPTLSYKYEARNTGNVHFSVTNYGSVKNIFAQKSGAETSYILMPGTTRTIRESVTLPTLPGLYELEYGYKDGRGGVTAKTALVLYVPPWSIAASLALILIILIIHGRAKRRRARTS